ncbi:hypothetical protein [Paraburkholderia caledonica]|uniref:hypothetical protein n=1 Tax=Paraburkholderia caledonica TaxID=134536 RepID=UPI0038B7FC55
MHQANKSLVRFQVSRRKIGVRQWTVSLSINATFLDAELARNNEKASIREMAVAGEAMASIAGFFNASRIGNELFRVIFHSSSRAVQICVGRVSI